MDPIAWRFHTPTRLAFAEGVVNGLGDELKALGIRRPLLVSDPGLAGVGLVERVAGLADGAEVTVFAEVEANPTAGTVHRGVGAAKAAGCDGIVALGGGSPLDAAKAMAVMATHPGDIREYEYLKQELTEPGLPVVTIPTTAGTAAELTWWSVITDRERQRKFDVGSPLMAPKLALDDPELTYGLPPALTAATGMDALTHAIEALSTKGRSPHTGALALEAIRLIGRYLPRAVADGSDKEARRMMLMASATAGLAFANAGLGAVHGLTAPIGGHLDLPHGDLNAALLPPVMDFNREVAAESYARIAHVWGLHAADPQVAADQAIERVRALSREVGIPTLKAMGVPEDLVPTLAAESISPVSNCNANPREVTVADAEAILRAALAE